MPKDYMHCWNLNSKPLRRAVKNKEHEKLALNKLGIINNVLIYNGADMLIIIMNHRLI